MIDIKFEIDGKPVSLDNFAENLETAAFEMLAKEIRESLGAVRDPQTGEFPTVVVRGRSIDSMSVQVEGTDAVIALAKERLAEMFDQADNDESLGQRERLPHAFLCHGSEDKVLVERIATGLRAAGIDVFFDQWCIEPGDSIRQRIDQGLEDCTHFVVLLTPASLTKPWVNAEIDAGFVKKLEGYCRFVPLRYGLGAEALPPLLAALNSPSIEDTSFDEDLRELVGFILGITRKPPLGEPAIAPTAATTKMGVSPAAKCLIDVMMAKTKNGALLDPMLEHDELIEACALTEDEIVDAVFELEGRNLVRTLIDSSAGRMGFATLAAEAALYVEFDKYYMDRDPANDAQRIAAELVNGEKDGLGVSVLADAFQWDARRVNPAVTYLIEREIVSSRSGLGHAPWCATWIRATHATRRFLSSRI